ncbi:sulfotransferase [Novosphingobium sp. ZN18A2]|uniref:tetratricopeptide repeat-containing sulfotransferase family protein n=1 Tax=Novosphingobium sp. ZN18A2 TaxID=3079861 RepID=UPI0030CEDEDD
MTGQDRVAQLHANATALLRQGATREAIDAYRALLAEKTDLPASWFNLGWLERQDRQFDNALTSYDKALRLGIDHAEEVHVNRASILADHLARPADAMAELHRALDLDPAYVPALLNLGNLHEDMGNVQDARDAYTRALQAAPGHPLALARLAGVCSIDSADDPLARSLAAIVAHPAAPPADRADAGFALARLLDACGEHDRAFTAATAANGAAIDSFGPRFTGYDARRAAAQVDALIAAFDKPAAQSASSNGPAPIFICGMFRSGSTLLEQILGRHPAVASGGELGALPAIVDRLGEDYPAGVAGMDEQTLTQLRKSYLAEIPEQLRGVQLFTDKRPDNFLHIGLAMALFPEARVLVTRRNPCDNAISVYFQHLSPQFGYGARLEDFADWYAQHQRLVAHWQALFPERLKIVDYDRLVASPHEEIASALAFLGLEWNDACLTPEQAAVQVRTASVWQVRQPLYRHASGRWRNYAQFMEPIASRFDCNAG